MKTIYIADDGTQFDDQWECLDYEWVLRHPLAKDIVLYNEDGEILNNLFDEETYEYVMKIVVPTDEAAYALRELGERNGWCSYSDVKTAGTWVWKIIDRLNGHFVKVE